MGKGNRQGQVPEARGGVQGREGGKVGGRRGKRHAHKRHSLKRLKTGWRCCMPSQHMHNRWPLACKPPRRCMHARVHASMAGAQQAHHLLAYPRKHISMNAHNHTNGLVHPPTHSFTRTIILTCPILSLAHSVSVTVSPSLGLRRSPTRLQQGVDLPVT